MNPIARPYRSSHLAPVLRPINAFLSAESAGGVLLMVAAVLALIWANSPWHQTYTDFWHGKFTVAAGSYKLALSVEHWVNDGLMVIFFLLVGLEIKREVLFGELTSLKRASLPFAAAIGGMAVPALVFLAFNAGTSGAAGWAVPTATDIAFAIGVLAIVGKSVPTSVKVFLLAVAIVDDLGAVLVIALFYTSQISVPALGVAAAFLAGLILLNLLRVHRPFPYLLLGLGLWAATLASGVHATVAGVLLAFTIPASRRIEETPYVVYMREMLTEFERDATAVPDRITEDQSHALKAMEEASQAVQTPLARVEHALLTPVTVFIVPIFALANAGVSVREGVTDQFRNPIFWGVLLGLFVGKPIGVLGASWLAVRSGVASLPEGGTWRHVVGVSALCGIGFTMSLFIGNLAFAGAGALLVGTKFGILAASVLAGGVGALLLRGAQRKVIVVEPRAV
jgi:NhaA family Na+:H+ antiporter